MLTDKDTNRAAHEAMPGIKPDGYSWVHASEINSIIEWTDEACKQWPEMKWIRVTHKKDDDTVWLEVWEKRPFKEAPFDPPYTLSVMVPTEST